MKEKKKRNNKISLYSIGEVRDMLGVHIETLRRMDTSGILKSVRMSPKGMRRYLKEDVDNFIANLKKN